MHTCMCLGLLSEDGVQADGKLDPLTTGWQQRSVERERWGLWPVQRLQKKD